MQVHFLTAHVAKYDQLNNQGSPADEIHFLFFLGIAQLEAVGFEQLSCWWWHRVMIILPIRRSRSRAMGGAETQVICIVLSVGRTRPGSFRHL
jgi:hypothetical protein